MYTVQTKKSVLYKLAEQTGRKIPYTLIARKTGETKDKHIL
jgi:hypothetical protein